MKKVIGRQVDTVSSLPYLSKIPRFFFIYSERFSVRRSENATQ